MHDLKEYKAEDALLIMSNNSLHTYGNVFDKEFIDSVKNKH